MTIVSFKQTNANGLVIVFDDLTVVPNPRLNKLKKHFLVLEAKDSTIVCRVCTEPRS